MTPVGKILVGLNLIFALAVGTFAVLSYAAGTKWQVAYTRLEQNFQAAQSAATTYKNEADQLTAERKDLNEKLVAATDKNIEKDLEIKDRRDPKAIAEAASRAARALASRRETIDRLNTQLKDAQAKWNAEKEKNDKFEANAQEHQKNLERAQVNVETLRKLVKSETDKNIQLVRDANNMRDQKVAAEIQAKSFREINNRLESQLQDMARDMARMRATGAASGARLASGVNPPPESIEGLVRRTEGNLVSITIGSDAGLVEGHTLQVFRLGQNPRYIGQIRIVKVQPNQAVGQIMGRMSTPIQSGDTVASRIMGGN